MSLQREGGSLAHPHVLDGTNYAYWKQRMEIYLTTIDERVWQCVLKRYTPTIKIDEDGVEFPKPIREWTNDELDAYGYNAKGLNAIVNGVDVFQHQLISTCKTSKAAWDILQSTFEGDNTVKRSKLQKLTSNFENLKMHDHETISEFYLESLLWLMTFLLLENLFLKKKFVEKS